MKKVKESQVERAARIKFSENGRKLRPRVVQDKRRKKDRFDMNKWMVENDHD